LLDLDGTLCEANDVLPGAAEVVARLRAQGRAFAVLSNSTDSPSHVSRRLARMGIQIEPARIFTAAAAAADFVLHRQSSRPRVFNLATEGTHELLDGKVDWVKHGDERCDAVVVGAPANVYATEERQRVALQLLRGGATLVGTCADRVYPSPRGLEFGSGAFTHFLAYAADVQPTFCGKPERIFFEELCHRLNVEPSQCILIGDNLEADIMGARAMGMVTVLTLSGITRAQDLSGLPTARMPHRVIRDLTEL
jgi:4-nitrophenyl phosphatase